jgi:UDP-2,3-diacylglucosamine hydrolase
MSASLGDLFISDVHLSRDSADRAAALAALLERHARRASRLFILGDLFNAWIGRKQLAAPYVAATADRLRVLTQSGVETHFIAGNRDFYGLEAIAQRTGMVTHKAGFTVESFGRRVWLCHGHELYANDSRTHLAQAITHSRPVEALFQSLPTRLATFLAQGYESHSSRAVRYKTRRELSIGDETLRRIFDAGHDDLVCGHTHRLVHVTCRWDGGEGHLWNLGSWQDGPHFLRHGPDGWHFHWLGAPR